jgi:hypothetical protein
MDLCLCRRRCKWANAGGERGGSAGAGVLIPVLTYLPPFFRPQGYDWQSMRDIRRVVDDEAGDIEELRAGGGAAPEGAEEQRKLAQAAKIPRWLTLGVTLAFLVWWPMPMFGSAYIFGKKFFTGWVTVEITWLFASSMMVIILPVWESKLTIVRTTRMMWEDLLGLGRASDGSLVDERSKEASRSNSQSPATEKTPETVRTRISRAGLI